MRALLLTLLFSLMLPRLGDDSVVHAAVCLKAVSATMEHVHALHQPMEHQQIQQSLNGEACQHCGDCGVHTGSALSASLQISNTPILSSALMTREIVHAISRPETLIRPPLA